MKNKKRGTKGDPVRVATVADWMLLMWLSIGLGVSLLIVAGVISQFEVLWLGINLTKIIPFWKLVVHCSWLMLAGMVILAILQGIYFCAKNILLANP